MVAFSKVPCYMTNIVENLLTCWVVFGVKRKKKYRNKQISIHLYSVKCSDGNKKEKPTKNKFE